MPIKKHQSVKTWKDKCWDLFSEIIRLRDCKETMGRTDWGKCCTCGIIKPFDELDAGHFIPGHHNAVYFDMRNVHAQCRHCNRFLEGNGPEYTPFMLKKYGQEVIDELKELNKQTVPLKVFHYQIMYNQFKVIKKSLEV